MQKYILILLFAYSGMLYAETVILKKGPSVRGKVVAQDVKGITVQTAKGKITIPKRNLLKVVYRDISTAEENKVRAEEEKKQGKTRFVKSEEIYMRDGRILYANVRRHKGRTIQVEMDKKESELLVAEIERIMFNQMVPVEQAELQEKKNNEIVKKQEEELKRQAKEKEEQRIAGIKRAEQEKTARELAITKKVDSERGRHNSLMKERLRLFYTEGDLAYSGGQVIHTELMIKQMGGYYAKTDYGLIHLGPRDLGDSFIIQTDSEETQKLGLNRMLAVKTEEPKDGDILLASGDVLHGRLGSRFNDTISVVTDRGQLSLPVSAIVFPEIPKETNLKKGIFLQEGEEGTFVVNDEQLITGKIVLLDKYRMVVQTSYGRLDLKPEFVVAAGKTSQEKKGKTK